jgi:hypothetical protein
LVLQIRDAQAFTISTRSAVDDALAIGRDEGKALLFGPEVMT